MTCSIYIYKPAKKPLVLEDDEISRSIFPAPSKPEDFEDEEELDVKFLITNLYEKIGELKRRIEILEARL